MIILETSASRASINPLGAELTSFFDKETGLEYVWQAGAEWPKSAPVLFPIVGALKNGTYTLNGKEYSLGRHGFARERQFEVEQISKHEAVFTLVSDESSRQVYPFDFALEIRWVLNGKTLESSYTVTNTGSKELLYSFGLHPAFTLCFDSSQGVETMALELPADEEWLLTAGLNPDSTHYADQKKLGKRVLSLSSDTFVADALIFEKLQSRSLKLKSSAHSHALNLSWSDNLDILGIWSKPKASFVCVEPWAGICDHQDSVGDFSQKKAIRQLPQGKREVFSFNAEIL
ncbi:MAG: aldose 1-epimerase family protein [Brevinema sp.]